MKMFKKTTLLERINLGMPNGGITSQAALARKMKVNRQTINRWFTGEGTKPEPEMLIKLADALNVSIRWLVTGQGDMAQEARLNAQQTEVLALWDTLPKAAKDHWLSQGRDLSTLLSPNGSNNPFSARRK